MPGHGKRVFPDNKTGTDTTSRNSVDVKVETGMPNTKVYLLALDVDDPTTDEVKQMIYVDLEILEEATVRTNKIQAFINQAKAQDLAAGASQALIDDLTQKNAEAVSTLDENYYVENRVGRFKLSAEYHSTQSGVWNGTVTSPEVIVDVVNKGSGFAALQNP